MLPDPATLAAYSFACVILALTPGPDMSLALSRTLAFGRAAGIACSLGAAFGLVVQSLAVALGLSALIAASPTAFLALKIVGALWLAWLAVEAIRKGSSMSLERTAPPARGLAAHFMAGLAINLLNPKVVIFFLTFLPQFVRADDPQAPARLLFLGFWFIAIGLPILLALVLGADRVAGLLRASPRAVRVLDWLFASVFLAFAARILVTRAG